MEQILHRELTYVEVIGQGGFGIVYRANHARFGTVVYKELDAKKLGDQYAALLKFNITALQSSVIQYKLFYSNISYCLHSLQYIKLVSCVAVSFLTLRCLCGNVSTVLLLHIYRNSCHLGYGLHRVQI